jgi:hypothetical protein
MIQSLSLNNADKLLDFTMTPFGLSYCGTPQFELYLQGQFIGNLTLPNNTNALCPFYLTCLYPTPFTIANVPSRNVQLKSGSNSFEIKPSQYIGLSSILLSITCMWSIGNLTDC